MGSRSGGLICIRTQTITCQAFDREMLHGSLLGGQAEKFGEGR